VTNTPGNTRIDLQEVLARNDTASDITAGFSTAMPTLATVWHYIETALADTVMLAAEVTLLHAELADVRLDRANFAAAAQATLTAYRDRESDPLSYLRDELRAQGYRAEWGRA
jgi:hypothetical protein